MWCPGWVPVGWTGEPDSPRGGPGPHPHHNHSCRHAGSGETGLSYPDSNWMADGTRAVLRQWVTPHRQQNGGGVGPGTMNTPNTWDPSRGMLGTRWDTAGTKIKDSGR